MVVREELASRSEGKSQVLCAHCALPVPDGLVEDGAERQFCCAGCRAVYETVSSCGLDGYYRLRDAAGASLARGAPGRKKYEAFGTASFEQLYVQAHGEAGERRSVDLFLEGVTCAACVWLVEKLPTVLPGVIEARLALKRATVRVTWDSRATDLPTICRTLDGFGYACHPARGVSREQVYRKEYRARLVKLGAAGALMGNLMLLGAAQYAGWVGDMDATSSMMLRVLTLVLGVLSLAWPGAEFFTSAWASVRARAVNLDVPIVIALATGGVAGVVNVLTGRGELYFDSLAMLVFLLLVGRFLQFRQQRQAESAVELLFSMTPSTSRVVGEDGEVREVPSEGLKVGDVVEVRAGELLPADGAVVSGASSVDQALLTGESMPVAVSVGSAVFGASLNGPGVLRVRVEKVGESSRVGQLMRLLEKGLSEKPEIVRFADRVGVAFTVAVTVLGAAVFAYWSQHSLERAIDATVAFLIVTCPCVLGLATPMTITLAIGQLARRDILVRSGGALEKLARGGRLVLDKTGTLTHGRLKVVEYCRDLSVRGLVAQAEARSNHPVARALVEAFSACEPPAELRGNVLVVDEHVGGGVSADLRGQRVLVGSAAYLGRHGVHVPVSVERTRNQQAGRTLVFVAVGTEVRGMAALADELRPDSARAVEQLRRLGFTPEVRSGDAQFVVDGLAPALRLSGDDVHGNQSPEEKLAAVRELSREHNTVMVGDGVNDAAALAAAGVGIAMHGGSEACLAAADVYVARPGLAPVVDVVQTARKTMRVIRRNFGVSLAYNVLAGTLAAMGIMNPLIAAILMPLSSASVLASAVASMKRR